MNYIVVSNIEDLSRNRMSTDRFPIMAWSDANAARVSYVAAQTRTRVTVFIQEQTSRLTTFDPSDFEIFYTSGSSAGRRAPVGIRSATLQPNGFELRLNLDRELDADATYNGQSLELRMAYNSNLSGSWLEGSFTNNWISRFPVEDRIASTLVDVVYGRSNAYQGTNHDARRNQITMVFDERVGPTSGSWYNTLTISIGGQVRQNMNTAAPVDGPNAQGNSGYYWTIDPLFGPCDSGFYYLVIDFRGTEGDNMHDVTVMINYLRIEGRGIRDEIAPGVASLHPFIRQLDPEITAAAHADQPGWYVLDPAPAVGGSRGPNIMGNFSRSVSNVYEPGDRTPPAP
jgi:hypothetical protein